jgi:hypothetical protein
VRSAGSHAFARHDAFDFDGTTPRVTMCGPQNFEVNAIAAVDLALAVALDDDEVGRGLCDAFRLFLLSIELQR